MGNYMITKERQFQQKFGQWMVKRRFMSMCELKISKGNTVSFAKFRDQQLPSLWRAYTNGIYYKLTDASMGMKPFDCFFYKGPAYVVIMFNIPDNQKEFYLIHIKEVINIKESGAKSITKKDCIRVGRLENL